MNYSQPPWEFTAYCHPLVNIGVPRTGTNFIAKVMPNLALRGHYYVGAGDLPLGWPGFEIILSLPLVIISMLLGISSRFGYER